MNRRIPLPGAAELFRRTSEGGRSAQRSAGESEPPGWFTPTKPPNGESSSAEAPAERSAKPARDRRGSPRQKHDAKITVYVSGNELLALEQARLTLRAEHELAVDRGRLVREAVAVLLADFEETGADSVLVRRLRQSDEQGGEAGK
ncbi:MAG: cobyrinic acid a,c-diamide synthase [Pseudonocardiaceae bacterium]|nr:cobyrinic acid a,c-diamide synthase [Pseudonocardiaceae bacterium]